MGLGQLDMFLLLQPTLINVWGMLNGSMTNYIPAWRLWLWKNWSVKFRERWNELWLLNKNSLSLQAVLLLFTSYTAQTQIIFSISLLNTLLQFSEESAVQISLLNVPLSLREYQSSMKYSTSMIVSLRFSVCIKILKNLYLHAKIDFWQNILLLMSNSVEGTLTVRNVFFIGMVNS